MLTFTHTNQSAEEPEDRFFSRVLGIHLHVPPVPNFSRSYQDSVA